MAAPERSAKRAISDVVRTGTPKSSHQIPPARSQSCWSISNAMHPLEGLQEFDPGVAARNDIVTGLGPKRVKNLFKTGVAHRLGDNRCRDSIKPRGQTEQFPIPVMQCDKNDGTTLGAQVAQ